MSSEESNEEILDTFMNETEFKKFLHKMFPNSANLKERIREMDAIDRKITEERKQQSIKENSDNDSEYSDSDSDVDDDDEPKFNIIVTLGSLDDYNSEDDSDFDSEWETTDEEMNDEISQIHRKSPIITRSKSKQEKNPKSNLENVENKVVPPKQQKQNRKNAYHVKPKKNEENKSNSIDEDKVEELEYENIVSKMIEQLNTLNGDYDDEIQKMMKEVLDKRQKKIEEKQKINKEKEELKVKQKNEKKFKKLIKRDKKVNDVTYFKKLNIEEQSRVLEKLETLENESKQEKPYSLIIVESDIPLVYKAIAMKKFKMFEMMEPGASDYYKNKLWVDTFMEIPFSKYAKLPVTMETSTHEEIIDFMKCSMKTLDNVVYGLDDAKMQIMQIIGKWIANPDSVGNTFAINGPPGTGKTTLIKDGVSKILNRPFEFIALGGATDSSYLEGHSYTYEGSVWGKIVQILINSKVMNPVIYFDELDKVSDSPRGEEIIGILTHLTDTSQNSQFHDKYFSGIDFDLSKALFIFSYNDETKINPILKDRMYRINTKGYNTKDKQIISTKYIIPNIMNSLNFKENDIIISDEIMDYINKNLTEDEKGVRNMKRCIETICSKLNLIRLSQNSKILGNNIDIDFKIPYEVTINDIKLLIKKNETEIPINMYT